MRGFLFHSDALASPTSLADGPSTSDPPSAGCEGDGNSGALLNRLATTVAAPYCFFTRAFTAPCSNRFHIPAESGSNAIVTGATRR